MNKFIILFVSCVILVFSGCTTKRQYFEPTKIDAEKSYAQTLPGEIIYTSKSGATLDNGDLITKNGLKTGMNLNKNDVFLGEYGGNYIISNIDGSLRIMNSSVSFEHKFSSQIIAASLENNLLASISSDNKIYLVDINSNNVLIEYASGVTYAQDSRMAAPIFLNSVILYPTLDGKVMIVDKTRARIIRDAVVSSEPFFNNIIFLDVAGDRLFAASGEKLIMISPEATRYYENKIKDAVLYADKIYILLKDGNIEITDLDLNSIKKKEFKYAIFSNIIAKGEWLYIFEKTGYLIQTDLNLENVKITELPSKIEDKSFAGKSAFYYNDKVLKVE